VSDPFPDSYRAPQGHRSTRRTALKGAAAVVGVAGAAAFAASETTSKHAPNAVASVAASSTRIDLGAAKYHAKGDGSDDSAALLAWRNDILAALDGGASGVHATVPCGRFAMGSSVTLDVLGNNVHLEGDGRGGSILTQLGKANVDILQTRGYASGGAPTNGFSITNLTLDGNATEQTEAHWCCTIHGYDYDIETVDMIHGGAGGLYSQWTDPGDVKYMEARIRGLGCREYLGLPGTQDPTYGILWAGPHDSQFSEILLSTLSAGQTNTGSSYGFVQAKGAAGEYISNMHVWGRHHYGIWADPQGNGIRLANVVSEGAFLANVVLCSGCSWVGGEAFGTNGDGGSQPRELGISLGIDQNAPHAPQAPGTTNGWQAGGTVIQGVRSWNFESPGACIDFTNSAGANLINVLAATSGGDPHGSLYRGKPLADDEVFLLDSQSRARLVQRLS
jgi:hypothetical protein